jgi:intraflagellar transport protein 46
MSSQEGVVENKQYDEAISIDDEDEDDLSTPPSSDAGSPRAEQPGASKGDPRPNAAKAGSRARQGGQAEEDSSSESSGESGSSSDSEAEGSGDAKKGSEPTGAYNPDDYKGMKVSSEVEELFTYIQRYKPHTIELDATLKPFIPELIPSIGEVDAFLKMPRPDGEPMGLGVTCLDEPTMNPSDPSILEFQLRSLSKHQEMEPMEVRFIENAEKNPKEIENWFRRVDELNRTKPAPTVQYTKRMPEIEQLMEIWPRDLEEFLEQNSLPELADLDLDLESYIKVIAALLDVPVHNHLTEPLHLIFTLYSEFRMNHHFAKADATGNFGGQDPYNFSHVPNFGTAPQGFAGAHGPGAAPTESMAPSRAPSPAGRGNDP